MINILDWVNETTPGNQFRGLDGKAYDFPFSEAVLVAQSGHDAFFKLNENWGWGVRWYALHRMGDRFVFTVGHGCWLTRREIPAEHVQDIVNRFFTRNEITDEGRALAK